MGERAEARWQSQITSLKEGIRKIYQTKDFSDITFTLKGEHDFPCHKLILAARSSEFQRILLDPNVVNPVFVEYESVTRTGFDILLCFIYTDEIGTDDKKSIVEAYIAADCYKQKALLRACIEKIDSWIVTQNDVWQLLNAGLTIPLLKDKCFDYIKNNVNEAISSPSFLNISFDCLNVILDNEVLRNVPVMERLDRIMAWAASRHTAPVKYASVRSEFLSNTPPLLGKLGIQTLTVDELKFVVKNYKGLLTSDELMGLTLHDIGDDSELPEWCKPPV